MMMGRPNAYPYSLVDHLVGWVEHGEEYADESGLTRRTRDFGRPFCPFPPLDFERWRPSTPTVDGREKSIRRASSRFSIRLADSRALGFPINRFLTLSSCVRALVSFGRSS